MIGIIRTISHSFTILTIIMLILGKLQIALPLNNTLIFQLFIICVGVALLQFITVAIFKSIFKIDSPIVLTILQFIDMSAVVFVLGGLLFKMFDFSLYSLVIIMPMLIVIFFFVFFVEFLSLSYKAKKINNIIKKRNSKK